MTTKENRPRGAVSEAARPTPIVRLTLDLSDVEVAQGWVTFDGMRDAHARISDALSAPAGVELVMRVGRIRPGLSIAEETWRELLSRYVVTIEASTPTVAREWYAFAAAVLGGGAHA